MTDHHDEQRVTEALAQISHSQRAIAQASVDLDRVAADLEVATIRVADLEDPRDPRLQRVLKGMRAEVDAWRAMSEALEENGRGSLSAADVCAVGFARQEALAAHPALSAAQPDEERGEAYEPDGPNTVRRVQASGESRALEQVVRHSPTGLNWGYGGSGPADLARSLLLDALGYHDLNHPDPDGLERVVDGLYDAFKTEIVATLPARGWRLEVATVRAWATGQVPELADTPAAGSSR